MKFGPVAVGKAAGAILAHTVAHAGDVIRKGTRLTDGHIAALKLAGVAEVVVARPAPTDVDEGKAAERIATAIAGDGVRVAPPFTGRANLHAEAAGLAIVDRVLIDRLNGVDQAITIATLPEFAAVAAGQMLATVKIIPFAVPRDKVDEAIAVTGGASAVGVAAFRPLKVGLVATMLPALKPSVMDKSRRVLDDRLRLAGAQVAAEVRVAHALAPLVAALADRRRRCDDLIVVFGASAMVDGEDVIPAAIKRADGRIVRLGMPVDPGNLLVLGDIDGTPVIGAPGCARSPKENGFDWILNRLLAGIAVTSGDIAGLGVGGLLMEIVSRPQSREGEGALRRRRQ